MVVIVIRNVLAVVLGWFIGSVVNMGLVNLGHQVFPMEGVDMNNMTALAEIMPSLGAEHFIFPFLAHALGTFVGAIVAALIAGSRKKTFALVIGGLFLIGGIAVNIMLPGPIWFAALDVLLAYIPMALLGWILVHRLFGNQKEEIISELIDD
ncbi:MAG: hypothetical protein N4A35_07870 [Flavobacteriales bacterium]|jgi:hypothetical protein|nr:hypothetical protein [Flavobacteriales bacterium]